MNIYGFDTETHLMGVGKVIPPIVCGQVYDLNNEKSYIFSTGDKGSLHSLTKNMLDEVEEDDEAVIVAHNLAYDLGVISAAFPDLIPQIFRLIYAGKFKDTIIREKLLNLTDHGDIDFRFWGNTAKRLVYDLASVVKARFGVDISEGKSGEDSWRMRYEELDGIPVSKWPQDAISYAMDDPVWAAKVYVDQITDAEKLIKEGIDPFTTEDFRVAADYCLFLATAYGTAVDPITVGQVSEEVFSALIPEKLPLLFTKDIWKEFPADAIEAAGVDPKSLKMSIVSKGKPPRPYKGGTKEHLPECEGHKEHPDYHPSRKVVCSCPPKMTAAQPEKLNSNVLRDFVRVLAEVEPEVTLKYGDLTDKMKEKGLTEGNLSVDSDWLAEHKGFHDVLMEYAARQELQKLATDYIPNLTRAIDEGGIIHAPFDVLKRTGRSSSSGGGKRHPKPFPAWNGQQVDPRVRKAIVPREGYIFYSLDWKAMELCTAAQKCLDLFGYSVLAEKINAGLDTHAFLGGQIAYHLDEGFAALCDSEDPDETFQKLWSLKSDKSDCDFPWAKHENEERIAKGQEPKEFVMSDFFKHFRNFAKPTGLGYPGGLGPRTFVAFARGTYGVSVNHETAKHLREIWLNVYPEFREYFRWIDHDAVDRRNGRREYKDKKTGKIKYQNKYVYTTPLGMVRSGCDYCAACNGNAMQSPGAEGALMAMIEATRATHDPEYEHPNLCWDENGYVSKPLLFIHDEIFGELRDEGAEINHARIMEQCRLMEGAFAAVATPDVKSTVEPALMRRCWTKVAEDAYDKKGHLIPWDDNPDNLEWAIKQGFIPEHLR